MRGLRAWLPSLTSLLTLVFLLQRDGISLVLYLARHDVQRHYLTTLNNVFFRWQYSLLCSLSTFVCMARLRTHGQVTVSPGGRSFYANPRKPTCRAKAPITPALREVLARRREERRAEYRSALKGARDTVHQQATQLREVFGGHSAEYYSQEILQRGRLERGRRKPSRWNAYLRHKLKLRNAGTRVVALIIPLLKQSSRVTCWGTEA
jgi:hypothetical protein